MSQRTKQLFLIGLLIGMLAVPIAFALTDSNSVSVSDGVPFGSPDGTNVTLNGQTNVSAENLFPDASTVDLTTEAGNVTFSSSGSVDATIDATNITGTWTKVSGLDVTASDLVINPEDKDQITVGDDIDRIEWRDSMGLDDGTADFVYSGSSGTSKVVLYDVPADTRIRAVDKDTGALLDGGKSDANGHLTLDSLDNSAHTVVLQSSSGPSVDSSTMSPTDTVRFEKVTLSVDVDDPDFSSEQLTVEWYVDGNKENTTTVDNAGTAQAIVGPLSDGAHDWYVKVIDSTGLTTTSDTKNFVIDHYSPTVSNISPTGQLQSDPTQTSALINDTDFALDGDTLSVTIKVDGSQISTATLNSNGTVSASLPNSATTGGEHTLNYTVTDNWGNSITEIETYEIPNEIFVRNETNHSELVAADGSIRFFGENEVYVRGTDDGSLNMTGLPVDQSFIVEVEPTNASYTDRTVYVENIYEQQSVYVLNTSAYDTIESRFVLNDPTGEYSSQSVLKIRRPINISGKTTFQTIVADKFGAEGVTAVLQNDTRYRLAVRNDDTEQTVGPYRAAVSETVEVQPGQPSIGLQFDDSGWAANADISDNTITYKYVDHEDDTNQLTVYIHERGNPNNLLQANETYRNLGNASGKVVLTGNETDTQWVVEFVADRGDDTVRKVVVLGGQRDLTPAIDSGWRAMIGVGSLILLAGAFSMLNAGIGAVIVSLVGGLLWFIGFLAGATSAVAIVIALFISVLGHAYSPRR